MPRPKSLVVSMEITTAGGAHDCRYNKNHRLEKGIRGSPSDRMVMSITIAWLARKRSS